MYTMSLRNNKNIILYVYRVSQNKLYRMVAISRIYEGILRPTNHHKWVHSML